MAAETLYLIDSHSIIYQVFHAIPNMTSPDGLPTNALFGFTRDLMFLREKKPTYLIAVFDVPGQVFREKIFPEYKAHRSPMPDDLQLQIPLIHNLLEAFCVPKLGVEGFEADDVIATVAKEAEKRGIDVFICTSDKDCRQLISDKVKMFNLRKQQVYDRNSLMEDWGIAPEQVVDFQTLVGDSVDNVPGVPGVGPKTATQYLQQYQTLANLIEHLNELKGKKKEALEQAIPNLEQGRQLVTLDTQMQIPLEWEKWEMRAWNGPKLLELFRGWGFNRFADEIKRGMPADQRKKRAKEIRFVQGNLFGDPVAGEDDAGGEDEFQGVPWPHTYHLVNTPELWDSFLISLKEQKRFAIDLETTGLEPRSCEIVGFAFCWKEGEAWYVPVRGPGMVLDLASGRYQSPGDGQSTGGLTPPRSADALMVEALVLAELKPIFENSAIQKINQNIKYDYQVLKNQGIVLRGVAGDSMVADYLLNAGERTHNMDELSEKHLNHRTIPISELIGSGKIQGRMDEVPVAKVAEYAGEDADVAWRLCDQLEKELGNLKLLYDDLEIPLIEVLGDMEFTGIHLDVPLLQKMGKEMEQQLVRVEEEIYQIAGKKFNINSVKQLREVLFKEMNFKTGKKTIIKGEASTNQATLEMLAAEGHELPKKLLQQRKIMKLKGTYVDALPALVNPQTGRVHASFNQTVAATGRLSSSDPNLQNIPIRSEEGESIRRAFLPEAGWKLLSADYSQIELRLLAHFCEDEHLRQAFVDGRDIHASVASQVFGVPESEVTGNQRRMAKTINFGLIYGISAFGLAARLEISKDEAGKFIDAYFAKYPKVLAYQDRLLQDCRRQGYVATILGRKRAINGIRAKTSYKGRNQPEREAINMQIQGSAADMIKIAMVNLHRRLAKENRRTRMLLQIHDELVFEVPPEELAEMTVIIRKEMMEAFGNKVTVPIGVDIGVGENWLDTVEV